MEAVPFDPDISLQIIDSRYCGRRRKFLGAVDEFQAASLRAEQRLENEWAGFPPPDFPPHPLRTRAKSVPPARVPGCASRGRKKKNLVFYLPTHPWMAPAFSKTEIHFFYTPCSTPSPGPPPSNPPPAISRTSTALGKPA